jgi:hypothetical protein
MNSKSRMNESWNGTGLKGVSVMLFAAVLMLGCERPLPDADKNPESGVTPPQHAPTSHDERRLNQRLRRTGPRTMITQFQPDHFVS